MSNSIKDIDYKRIILLCMYVNNLFCFCWCELEISRANKPIITNHTNCFLKFINLIELSQNLGYVLAQSTAGSGSQKKKASASRWRTVGKYLWSGPSLSIEIFHCRIKYLCIKTTKKGSKNLWLYMERGIRFCNEMWRWVSLKAKKERDVIYERPLTQLIYSN